LLTAFGGGVFARDAKGNYDPTQVLLDNAGSVKAASELDAMVKSGVLKDGVTYDVAKDLFLKGKLAMWINGPWELDNIRKAGIKFGIALIPKGTQNARPFVGVQGFMVSKLSKNQLVAQAFVTEFLATSEIMQKLYEAQFGIGLAAHARKGDERGDSRLFRLGRQWRSDASHPGHGLSVECREQCLQPGLPAEGGPRCGHERSRHRAA
jgi:maltose-binding protein MalE